MALSQRAKTTLGVGSAVLIAGLCNALNVTVEHGAGHDVLSKPSQANSASLFLPA